MQLIVALFVIFVIAFVLGMVGVILRNYLVANPTVVQIRNWIDLIVERTVLSAAFFFGFGIVILTWILVANTGWSIQYAHGPIWMYQTIWYVLIPVCLISICLNRTWARGAVVMAGVLAVGLLVFQGNFNTSGELVSRDGWATGEKANFVVLKGGEVVKTNRKIYSRVKLQTNGEAYAFYMVRWMGFSKVLVHVAVGTPDDAISNERALAFNATTQYRERFDGCPSFESASAYPNPWDTVKIDSSAITWPDGWFATTRDPVLEKARSTQNDPDPGGPWQTPSISSAPGTISGQNQL